MACNCIQEVNEKLKEQGVELVLAFTTPDFTAVVPVQTQWLNGVKKRKKPMTVIPSFCSLCGVKVKDESASAKGEQS